MRGASVYPVYGLSIHHTVLNGFSSFVATKELAERMGPSRYLDAIKKFKELLKEVRKECGGCYADALEEIVNRMNITDTLKDENIVLATQALCELMDWELKAEPV